MKTSVSLVQFLKSKYQVEYRNYISDKYLILIFVILAGMIASLFFARGLWIELVQINVLVFAVSVYLVILLIFFMYKRLVLRFGKESIARRVIKSKKELISSWEGFIISESQLRELESINDFDQKMKYLTTWKMPNGRTFIASTDQFEHEEILTLYDDWISQFKATNLKYSRQILGLRNQINEIENYL